MSIRDKRELEIYPDTGGSITLERVNGSIQITRTVYYQCLGGDDAPIELDTADRLALIDFLNMGEYRLLSKEGR